MRKLVAAFAVVISLFLGCQAAFAGPLEPPDWPPDSPPVTSAVSH